MDVLRAWPKPLKKDAMPQKRLLRRSAGRADWARDRKVLLTRGRHLVVWYLKLWQKRYRVWYRTGTDNHRYNIYTGMSARNQRAYQAIRIHRFWRGVGNSYVQWLRAWQFPKRGICLYWYSAIGEAAYHIADITAGPDTTAAYASALW